MVSVLLCPLSDGGYLYPIVAVGRELRRRGHAVHLLGRGTRAGPAHAAGLPYLAVEEYGGARCLDAARWFGSAGGQYAAIRAAAREVRADVLVTSLLCTGALLAAEALDLPVTVVGLAVHLWNYANDPPEPARAWRTREMVDQYLAGRATTGLAPRSRREAERALAGDALLLRGGPALEAPGAVLPPAVRHVGWCWWEPPPDPDRLAAVHDQLDQRAAPVVYVHLGRTFGGTSMWPRLRAAVAGGRLQAVIELGRTREPERPPDAGMLLVREPWLGPLVERASVVLTNATSTPVLAALRYGRPLAVAPAGSEQPVLAHACEKAGVAVRLPERGAGPVLAAAALSPVLRARAARLGRWGIAADGHRTAADAVELLTTSVARPR
jgi:UDP:flavonoid glycosyltransferase YjiC (YdhE family)